MQGKSHYRLTICFCFLLMAACDDGHNYAPVTEVSAIEPLPKSGVHRAMPGETLYEIAWRYGLDYRDLVERNHIQQPYAIHSGQMIYLQGEGSTITAAQSEPPVEIHSTYSLNKAKPQPSYVTNLHPIPPSRPKDFAQSKGWIMPAEGKMIVPFSNSHKGINISGHSGEPIYAVAEGKVVYCGNGLRGYGNLILIKHNNLYLSAYAHNRENLVKEGEWVRQGQKIAEMGNTGTNKAMLHFEIRRAGKPVDPMKLIGLDK